MVSRAYFALQYTFFVSSESNVQISSGAAGESPRHPARLNPPTCGEDATSSAQRLIPTDSRNSELTEMINDHRPQRRRGFSSPLDCSGGFPRRLPRNAWPPTSRWPASITSSAARGSSVTSLRPRSLAMSTVFQAARRRRCAGDAAAPLCPANRRRRPQRTRRRRPTRGAGYRLQRRRQRDQDRPADPTAAQRTLYCLNRPSSSRTT